MRIVKLTESYFLLANCVNAHLFRCALTQLANKKYDSFNFAIRITFEQV